MNKLLNSIEEYVTNKINYLDFINAIKNITPLELNDIVKISNTTNLEQRMIAILTIYLFNYSKFTLTDETNIYINFIKEFIEDSVITNFKIYEVTNDYLIGKLITSNKDYIIILNPTKAEINLTLPLDIANKTYYCYNCNDELNIDSFLEIPDYSFYVLKEL